MSMEKLRQTRGGFSPVDREHIRDEAKMAVPQRCATRQFRRKIGRCIARNAGKPPETRQQHDAAAT
jgi:hypothetical protein